jgi:hypothetical protein
MRPPIFPPQSGGTDAQQYLHRARQFREAATRLPDSRNGDQNWPKYALITSRHRTGVEGLVFHSAASKTILNEPRQHDLVGWYEAAVRFGLEYDATTAENVGFLTCPGRCTLCKPIDVGSASPILCGIEG